MDTENKFKELKNKYPQCFSPYCSICLCIEIGWLPLVEEICETSNKLNANTQITHIKEKYAGLRVSYTTNNSEISKLIIDTQNKSHTICMYCGNEGRLRTMIGYWLHTICDLCHSVQMNENQT